MIKKTFWVPITTYYSKILSSKIYQLKSWATNISTAPISGPFDALIDDGINFDASIKKPKFGMPKKG